MSARRIPTWSIPTRGARSSPSARTPATTTAARSPSAPTAICTSAIGDGGNANDVGASHIEPGGNAQNLTTPLGKMLRIDPLNPALTAGSPDPVSANGQYRIPAGNPFQAAGQVPEIYAYGFRNPYRFAFDRTNGDLILADVGQNNIEEIDRVMIGGNYGWAVKEGDFLFNRTDPGAGTIGVRSPGRPRRTDRPDLRHAGARSSTTTATASRSPAASSTAAPRSRSCSASTSSATWRCAPVARRTARRRPAVLRRPRDRRDQRVPAPAVRQRHPAQRADRARLRRGRRGELYALVTNTPANGTGGIVYQITAVPEPATWISFGAGALVLLTIARRRRANVRTP